MDGLFLTDAEDWSEFKPLGVTCHTLDQQLQVNWVLTWMPEVVKYGISNLTLIGGCKRYQDQSKIRPWVSSVKHKINQMHGQTKAKQNGLKAKPTFPSLSSPTTEGRPKCALIRYSCHSVQCHWVFSCFKWEFSLFLRGRTWWSRSLHSAQGHTCNGLVKKISFQNHFFRTAISSLN